MQHYYCHLRKHLRKHKMKWGAVIEKNIDQIKIFLLLNYYKAGWYRINTSLLYLSYPKYRKNCR